MTTRSAAGRVGELLLVRLLLADDRGETPANVRKAVEPLLPQRGPGGEPDDVVDEAFRRLEADGSIARVEPAGKGKGKARGVRWALTAEGRARALAVLGIDALPTKATWAKVRDGWLLARALGTPAPGAPELKRLGTKGGLHAALLKGLYGLPVAGFPTSKQAVDALIWKLLGVETDAPLKLPNLKKALLNRELGLSPEPTEAKAVESLLARAYEARNKTPAELRAAALRRWVVAAEAVAEEADRRPIDLAEFARRVVNAARGCESGRYGSEKVFISHVWRALHHDPATHGHDLDAFKRQLGEANRARLLDLARADLVEAMDRADVAESAMEYLGGTFHFIRV
ncbi:MAG TPA: hypothetical protein VG406_13265 [Isosphaeraceae bacterium]|jgi:hypothetical protein|nr:hypothetical protein [Isosphaeraceae bacterium]